MIDQAVISEEADSSYRGTGESDMDVIYNRHWLFTGPRTVNSLWAIHWSRNIDILLFTYIYKLSYDYYSNELGSQL